MNNIHISYQQKPHHFGRKKVQQIQTNNQISSKPPNTLLYKYARSKDADEDQQSLINKKPIVFHGNSLNYSQLFNNIKISKNIDQSRERHNRHDQYENTGLMKNSQSQYQHQNIKKQIQFKPNFMYVPKSLPKIVKNKRHSHYMQPPKYAINSTFDERHQPELSKVDQDQEKRQVRLQKTKNKSFSISHYDIFINDGKKTGIITTALQREQLKQDYNSQQNHQSSSLGQSFQSKIEEGDGKLKINFENELQKQIPEFKQTIFEASNNNIIKKEDNYVTVQEASAHPNLAQMINSNVQSQNNSSVMKNSQNQNNNFKKSIKPIKNHEQDLLNLNFSKIQQKISQRNNQTYKIPQSKKQQYKPHQKKEYKQQIQLFNKSFKQKSSTRKHIRQIDNSQNNVKNMHLQGSNHDGQKQHQHKSRQLKQSSQFQSKELIIEMTRQNHKKSIIDKYDNKYDQYQDEHRHKQHIINHNQGNKQSLGHHKKQQSIENHEITHRAHNNNEIKEHPPHGYNTQLSSTNNKQNNKKQSNHLNQYQQGQISHHNEHNNNFKKNEEPTAKNNDEFVKDNKQNNNIDIIQQLEYKKFDVQTYIKVYEILKNIQTSLKLAQIDLHAVIKNIKNYLQVIAGGNLDNFQGYDIPLNRLKIIKNALLYQRIAMVILSLAYATNKIKQCLKYIINITIYTTNNTLIILKILQSSEISLQNKNPILAKSDRLIVKRNFDTVRNNNDVILDSIFKISKNQEAFHESFKEILKGIGKSSIQQTFYNVLQYFAFFLCISNLYKNIPFLAVAPNPYLRQSFEKKPTLVIDIIQVFCHGTKKSKSHVFRPHTQHFLHEMAQYYEIISFTCAYPNQIDKVIDILDTRKSIQHRLYRHHTVPKNNYLYKDTQRIGRDLTKLILLDSDNNIQHDEINNTIYIPNWKGNKSDTTLAELCPILAAISIKNLDCKEATKKIHQQKLKNQHQGIKYINFGLNLE